VITPRLQCIINHTSGNVIADIGTDHAYIPIKLIEDGICDKVIASDIKEDPVEIAKQNIKKYNAEDKIEVRLGGGLSVLSENEADTIIIAGMGGEMIEAIIHENEAIAKSALLILQPMNSQYELRKYLILNGYSIIDEDIAIEGFKVYNVMTVKKGTQAAFENDIEYHLPKYLIKHKYFKNLYDKKRREFIKVINGLENSKKINTEKLEKYKFWLKELEKYESD
jgi:tRNA (adenine22-N1)-methyltransferase